MDINTLKAFVEVAETTSFSKAAESLFLTQPAVSKRIASLEQELNVLLFDRIGKNVVLTEAGNKLLPKALDMLNQAEDIRRLASNLENEVKGELKIGTSHHIGLRRLPAVLKSFIKRYPDVDLDIRFMDSEDACHAVERGDLELAIVTLPHTPKEKLDLELIWDDPLAIMVNQDHPLNTDQAITVSLLSEHPAVIPGKGTYTREILERVLKDYDLKPKVAMSTNYLETLKMLASIGLGWTLLPVSMQDKELVQLKLPQLTVSRSLGIVTHKDRTLSNPADAMRLICQNQKNL